jgi:hypothetical protein
MFGLIFENKSKSTYKLRIIKEVVLVNPIGFGIIRPIFTIQTGIQSEFLPIVFSETNKKTLNI